LNRFKRSLSFSNVIAVVALFFALGGTVYAASKISGSQIKPKSIPANRIKSHSLTGTQIKAGSLTGTQVVGTTLKGVSASSLAAVQYVSVPVTLAEGFSSSTAGTATCPVGQKVIGGGATVNNEVAAFVNDSGPSVDRSSWAANGFSTAPGVTMTVTAICTAVVAPTG
jgi:hypothetical protein